jgi:GAF domain-containing protein
VTRRGTENRKPAKTHRRKTTRPKGSNASTAARQRSPSVVDLQEQLDARTRQLNEAIERENATAEVLRVISSSPGELAPVFEAMLANAVRLCEAKFGMLFLHERGALNIVAHHNVPPEVHEARRSFQPHPDGALGKMLRTKQMVHVDLASTRAYAERHPATVEAVELRGIRTNLCVPMLKHEEVVGVIVIFRQEVRPFTARQIELVQYFAAQALIAIENARLFEEVQARTHELTESLEYQTAISEVLSVISRSPTDIQPVLDTVADNAARLCKAFDAAIFRRDGDRLLLVAHHGAIPILTSVPVVRGTINGRAVLDGRTVQAADVQAEADEFPVASVLSRASGDVHTQLSVPLMRDGVAIGTINLRRTEVRLFTERQVALLETFADQAVIAIENTRLFQEVQARTRELTETLEQQTATSEVLSVISSSPTDVQPVLDAIVKTAATLCNYTMQSSY